MSFQKFSYLRALHDVDMPPVTQLVLRLIVDYSDQNGRNACPAIARLARNCGISERTVQRHLSWLRTNGFITLRSRGGRSGPRDQASLYDLVPQSEWTRSDDTSDVWSSDEQIDPANIDNASHDTDVAHSQNGSHVASDVWSVPITRHQSRVIDADHTTPVTRPHDTSVTQSDPLSDPYLKDPPREQRKRASYLPDDWTPAPRTVELLRELLRKEQITLDLETEADAFRDHYASTAKNAKHRDWDAAFRNWVRKSVGWARERGPINGSRHHQTAHDRKTDVHASLMREFATDDQQQQLAFANPKELQ